MENIENVSYEVDIINRIKNYVTEHDEPIVGEFVKVVGAIFDEIGRRGYKEYEQTQLAFMSCAFKAGEMEKFVHRLSSLKFSMSVYEGVILIKDLHERNIYTIIYNHYDRDGSWNTDEEYAKIFSNETQCLDISIYNGKSIASSTSWIEMGSYGCGNYHYYTEIGELNDEERHVFERNINGRIMTDKTGFEMDKMKELENSRNGISEIYN